MTRERGIFTTATISPELLYCGRLYFFSGNGAVLTCLDARTGCLLMDRGRLAHLGTVYASPVGAAGRLYLCDRDGTTVVLKEGPELKVLAVNRLDDGFNASPAVAGNDLFLRGRSLYCLAEQGAPSPGSR